ncbi:DUF2812 domain-containing protein [Paenibacillus albus]|uniref:DUF2812 domain-containing protein n=1 Tax=Paenibacillus albus TaxID=2495582 RepID=A0A3S8ZZB5_9BACL|nr:DUF2812 domain-containing protein [Paenibacillus albus]AZN38802.1 DUF2812 domain-containing protein [Paenibacillus albus]
MTIPTEKKYRLSMSWNYEKDEAWLSEQSRQGLQLKKVGLFSYTFTRDAAMRYTYALDFQNRLGRGDKYEAYLELYRDAGWEHVSSYGGMWHYFRREWQPGELPRLYTDRESLVTHFQKIKRVFTVLLFANLAIMIINMLNLLSRFNDRPWSIIVPILVIYVGIFIMLGYGISAFGKKIQKLQQ